MRKISIARRRRHGRFIPKIEWPVVPNIWRREIADCGERTTYMTNEELG